MAGIDYKHSNVELREKVYFTSSSIERAYDKIKSQGMFLESVILSTCNRSEIYAIVENKNERECIYDFYSLFFNIDINEISNHMVYREGNQVIQHLFEVANGFQSMVFGEDQILGQVKDAYNLALSNKSSGKILNRLFLNAITNAKKIRTVTGISKNSTSISSIGVKLISKHLGDLSNKKALVVGLGKMSKLAIEYLLYENIESIYVTNRTKSKVVDFQNMFPSVKGIDFKDRHEAIEDVDILISCTSAPHFVIHKQEFLSKYTGNSFCILDLSLPRDVEPEIADIEGVSLYVIDHIEKIAKENEEKRMEALEEGRMIIKEDIDKYIDWIKKNDISIGGLKSILK